MKQSPLWAVEWRQGEETLAAIEPTAEELGRAAPELAAFYNDSHNRAMMGHTSDAYTAADVIAYYQQLRAQAGRPFLLLRDAVLLGDADFRNIDGGAGEFAIMIGGRAMQGRGLGTRFGLMLHAFGYGVLGLERIYVSVIPANTASRRLFEKLGYRIDDSPAARAYIDEESDLTMSLERATFGGTPAAQGAAAVRTFERAVDRA